MYSTSLRRSVSVVQKPSGVAARLLSYTPGRVKIGKVDSFGGVEIPGLAPKGNVSESTDTGTGTSGATSAAPSNPTAVNNKTSINKYARRLNKYKAGQSPATVYPQRTRSSQPGLSWLGDDEFESTGLAFRLARHHVQRVAARRHTGGPSPNKNANSGSSPRNNDEKTRTRTKAASNVDKKAPQPRKDLAQKSRPKQVGVTKTERPETVKPGVSTRPATPYLAPKPSSVPIRVNLKSTDFTSLFGGSSSLSAAPSSTSTIISPTNNVSRRVQLALEHHGGDYSNLVSGSLVTSQGSPIVYAESTMARRRDLGPEGRNAALRIIQGMINKSHGSRPTA